MEKELSLKLTVQILGKRKTFDLINIRNYPNPITGVDGLVFGKPDIKLLENKCQILTNKKGTDESKWGRRHKDLISLKTFFESNPEPTFGDMQEFVSSNCLEIWPVDFIRPDHNKYVRIINEISSMSVLCVLPFFEEFMYPLSAHLKSRFTSELATYNTHLFQITRVFLYDYLNKKINGELTKTLFGVPHPLDSVYTLSIREYMQEALHKSVIRPCDIQVVVQTLLGPNYSSCLDSLGSLLGTVLDYSRTFKDNLTHFIAEVLGTQAIYCLGRDLYVKVVPTLFLCKVPVFLQLDYCGTQYTWDTTVNIDMNNKIHYKQFLEEMTTK